MSKQPFRLEEGTIDELHQAIRSGEATCVASCAHYLARVRAYNGVASAARDGGRRAGSRRRPAPSRGGPLHFPTETVKASTLLPDLDEYKGPRSNSAAWSRPRRTRRCSSNSA